MPTDPAGYQFAGWTIASDFHLPELHASSAAADWRIVRGSVSLRQRHTSWYQRTNASDGMPWVWFGARGAIDVIRFPGLAWCEVDSRVGQVTCTWRRHLGHEEPEHLLVNHILPLAASTVGFLVLHASVVARPSGGAVAIIGPVGAGKSTLAAYLATRGWKIVSDDRLIVDGAGRAYATAPYVRISPAAAARFGMNAALPHGHHKVRIPLGRGSWSWEAQPRSLERIVFLQRDPATTRLEPLRGREASFELLTAMLQLGLNREDVKRRVFDGVAAIAGSVQCGRLRMAAKWESLGDAESVLQNG